MVFKTFWSGTDSINHRVQSIYKYCYVGQILHVHSGTREIFLVASLGQSIKMQSNYGLVQGQGLEKGHIEVSSFAVLALFCLSSFSGF